MLATYFKEPCTLAVFRCRPAGSQLDRFIIWLEIRGYRRACIRRHSREAHRFAVWAQSEGLPPTLRPGKFTVPDKLIASLHGKVL